MPELDEHTDISPSPPRELIEVDDELMGDIEELVRSKSDFLLLNIIQDLYPADIAHIMNRLENEQAEYVFGLLPGEVGGETLLHLDGSHREDLLKKLDRSRLQEVLIGMASDDAADIVGLLPQDEAAEILAKMDVRESSKVEELLHYDERTAGGIMEKETADVNYKDTVKKAIKEVREFAKTHKNVYSVYVTDDNGVLVGLVPLQDLLIHAPNRRMHKIMNPDVISVTTDVDQEEVARVVKKYGIISIPVTDNAGKLLGRITVDDIVDVIEEEHEEDVARLVGSEAIELERRSPAQIAFLRLPWVLITLVLEMFAGVVVHQFDKTLSQVILLASFMPIISAISGNTGLQSAAMIVRGIATGTINIKSWWIPVTRQFQTTLIIGSVCGLALATVGAVWHGRWVFGLAVGISMFLSINISGFVGTVTPMISKSLGFDPAITAGPFETAFQDVVGITIFLSIATMLLRWL
ncbi:MAG: magnesium transporter [Ignavibacteriales bacterium]|nr:magnesium transporter [Ignavibacteriales bacterium]